MFYFAAHIQAITTLLCPEASLAGGWGFMLGMAGAVL